MARLIGPLVSVPAQNDATWTLRSADIAQFVGKKARLVIYHPSGPAYDGDVQLDDFNIGGNIFDPETGTNNFETQVVADNIQLTEFTLPTVQNAYDLVDWRKILTDGDTHTPSTDAGFFWRDGFGTPSGNTGNTTGNTGNYYYFVENSYDGSNNDVWLRSPQVTLNTNTFSFYSAQNGLNSGAIYAFLEVEDADVAVYGKAVYGVARYGELPIDVQLSGVQAVGIVGPNAIVFADSVTTVIGTSSSATADTDVIITADATHTLVSVSAAFAQGSVGVVGVAIHQVDGVQATGQNNTAVISADANVPTTGTVGSVLVGTAIAKASATAQPTGVFATGVADVSGTGWKVFSRVIVPVTVSAVGVATVNDVVVTADAVSGVSGSTAIGAVGVTTIVAKATTPVTGTTATASVDDVVVTADSVLTSQSLSATASVTDVTVTADAILLPTGVLASATADTDIVITADSNHTLVSVSAAFAQGQIGVIGVAIVESQAVNATGYTGVTVITADSNYTTNSVEGSVTVDTDSVVTADANTPVATGANVGSVGNTVVVAEANTLLTSVLGFGQMGGNVVVAEANTLTDSVEATGFIGDGYTFIEGVGEFAPVVGEEATGFVGNTVVTADNVYVPDSVFATVTADTDIIITADSVHTLISVVGAALNGGVGEVTADGVVNLEDYSVEATGHVNDNLFIVAEALVLPTAETATGVIGEPVVVADSNTSIATERMRTTIGSVVVEADSVLSVAGLQAQAFLEDGYEVTASALQTVSGFALTLSKTDPDVTTEVTIFYPDAFALDRVAYVPTREGSNNRTAIVSATESRVAHVPADTQSRTIPIAA